MSLRQVQEVVVASTDVAAAVRFHLDAFGFEVLEGTVDGADGVLLGVPGSAGGRLRLVPAADAAGQAPPPAVWDPGARLLGIYSRVLPATAAAIAAAGGAPRTPVTYPYGSASLSELVARGTDGVWWTIPKAVAGAHRPSPALEGDAERLHSELHTVVLVVDDHDAAVRFFVAAGLRVAFDGTMTGAEFEELVGMPQKAALRLSFLVGPDEAPARLEIMSFQGVPAMDRSRDAVGITRIVFAADDPSDTRAAMLAAGAEELGGGLLRGPAGVEIALVAGEDDVAGDETAADPAGPTVIVIGGGSSGLCTTIAAATHGARVHLIDKQARLGGMLHIANGEFSGAGTRRQRERGIDDDPKRHFEDVLRLSHGKVNRDLAWLSVSLQGEMVDWLDELGFEFDPAAPGLVHGHEVYSVPRTYWGVNHGLSVLRLLERLLAPLVESGQVVLHLNTAVTELVTASGRVTGVRVRGTEGGDERQLRADAVVLATGGYDANPQLRNQFLPEHCTSALIGCLDHATGDGLLMARELGAAVSRDGVFLPVMGLIPDPDRPGFAVDYREASLEMAPAYRTPYEIWVNERGERFVPEDTSSPELRERTLLEQPDVTMHVLFDQAAVEAAPVPLIRNGRGDWTRERFAEACRTSPWVTRAQTLEELARKLDIDPAALVDTVSRYNAAVDAGADPDFGRSVLPARIESGPFYAMTSVAASILSRDGLRVNTDMAVLDESGNPIAGLYAVGEVLGNNVFAGDNYVGGMSVTPAMTLGRRLGARLAAHL